MKTMNIQNNLNRVTLSDNAPSSSPLYYFTDSVWFFAYWVFYYYFEKNILPKRIQAGVLI